MNNKQLIRANWDRDGSDDGITLDRLVEAARSDEREKLYTMLGNIKAGDPSKILQQILDIRGKLMPTESMSSNP